MSTAPIDLEVTLRRFARQAQSLTLAGGASIALSSDLPGSGDEMTCRASAGKAAPLVGARLRLVPGLKRECLREGKPLRCDDSEIDSRVDRDRCRKLGVRSVVAVPLKSKESVVGIIEIFSTRTKAFTESHMAKLHVLAERVTDAVNGVEPAPATPVAMPEVIWADVFVESRLPWKRLLQSAVCHVVVVAAVWNLSLNWAKSERILSRSIPRPSQLIFSPRHASFPAARSHRPPAEASARGGSEPARPAPIVVKGGGGEPSAAPPVVNMPGSGKLELAGLRAPLSAAPVLGSIDSPERTSLAANGRPAQTSIVAPPPEVIRALEQNRVAAPGAFVVGPSPTLNGPVRTAAGVSLGRSSVVAPAPGLSPVEGAMLTSMNSAMTSGLGGVPAVVGPPPSLPLHEGTGGSGLALGGAGRVVGPPAAFPMYEGSGGSRMMLGGGNTVVGPAPGMNEGGGLRGGSGIGGTRLGGGDAVIAPAPGLPSGVRSSSTSVGLGGTGTGMVIGPPPGLPSGARGISAAGFGGSGFSAEALPPSVVGMGGSGTGLGGGTSGDGSGSGSSGSGSGMGSGSGAESGSGSGSGPASVPGSGTQIASSGSLGVATGAGEAHSDPKSIRTSVPPQAPTHLDEPAGRILEVPVRVLGLALALPSTSFFSNYEVFIAERQFAKSETQLIKLVYESRPTQRRLSEYGVDVATTYKLRVKRDPSCDETAEQITGGHYSEMQNSSPDAALRSADKDSVLPCYRTTADDYQKVIAKKR